MDIDSIDHLLYSQSDMKMVNKLINRWKTNRKVDLTEQDFSVELKPLLGIKPELYLRILFSALVLLVLFILILLPGLKNYGSLITVNSTPNHAALYIDGKYSGQTPLTLFVPAGKRRFKLEYTGVEKNLQEVEVKGRRLFSRFFPKRRDLELAAKMIDAQAAAEALEKRFLQLSCYHTFEKGTAPPALATEAVQRILTAPPEQARPVLLSTLKRLLPVANTPELKKDLFSALILAFSTGNSSKPAHILAAELLIDGSNELPDLFLTYYLRFSPQQRDEIKATESWIRYRENLIRYCSTSLSPDFGQPTGRVRNVSGVRFTQYKGGIASVDNEALKKALSRLQANKIPSSIPQIFKCGDFELSELVNGGDFQLFLRNNPKKVAQWKDSGLVNRYFNEDQSTGAASALSWHAAKDYSLDKGFNLPHPIQLLKSSVTEGFVDGAEFGVRERSTGFQEWTRLSLINNRFSGDLLLPERVICFKDDENNDRYASFPADFCTHRTGFRMAGGSPVLPIRLNQQ